MKARIAQMALVILITACGKEAAPPKRLPSTEELLAQCERISHGFGYTLESAKAGCQCIYVDKRPKSECDAMAVEEQD